MHYRGGGRCVDRLDEQHACGACRECALISAPERPHAAGAVARIVGDGCIGAEAIRERVATRDACSDTLALRNARAAHEHCHLAAEASRIERDGVAEAAGEDHGRVAELSPCSGTGCGTWRQRNPSRTGGECLLPDRETRRRPLQREGTVWEILEVRTVVAGRFETEAMEHVCDVGGRLVVAECADLATLHGVVGDLVEASAEIVRSDCGFSRARRPGARTLVGPDGAIGARCGLLS